MMITQNLIFHFTCSSLLILSLPFFFQTCNANCTPSACGIIPNISSPFRLKGDPKHCGDRRYELVCENNVTSIYLNSHKYFVKAIRYSHFTIRLADVFFINNDSCSFPMSNAYETTYFDPYSLAVNRHINFVSCQHPLRNSSLFTQLSDCEQTRTHTYVMVGQMRLTDMDYMCTLDSVVATSWNITDLNNVSVSEIHQSLLYGFDLSWRGFACRKCRFGCTTLSNVPDGIVLCDEFHSDFYYNWVDIKNSFQPPDGPAAGCLMICGLIVAIVFAGVSIPAKIIIGFGISYWAFVHYWYRSNIQRVIVIGSEVRFIVGILCGTGFLIYKYRRRRLSMYEDIEGFLQSDNKLSPIRYSYSDIKRMTRGFREKLGEGGYGSVYKGKLRSGHHVAVKLLGKATANGQDFINEIGTIGRIHHVNVIQLVGYCADRSKRALIFDFMPNGSLDKYIFNRGREKASSLDWDMKFKIAVEVARGIEYLHCGCDIQILHFDIKPHNILLDDKFVPKISDFGLAKLCSIEKETVTMTAARGTIGYVAPELINRSIGAVSYKADVYSFGMLLMEMVGLNRELKGNNGDSSKYFPCWIYDQFNQGREIEIENASEGVIESKKSIVRKMTIVALWRIQMNPDDRPSMSQVLGMLEADVERLQIPEYPPESTHVAGNGEETWVTDSTVSLLHYNNGSNIEISIA